ncbi:hypothetical protein CUR178_04118 [Leishmania enriettii]|uniref:Phosphate transporter n=1 Tax=Leishmania enriettii TaxID=5663 RepID=A0A836KIF2_LEIEN|nr:hypothetical protein CUR178_04118 [Leishmania enriettii]
MADPSTCKLDVNTTLPLVCICTLLSFLCGVGIGANDLSANFAMVVGSGSLNMKAAIIYCTVFELLGAAFMGGHVSKTIRSGIVDPLLFAHNKDIVVIGMTCASFAAALWLYLSTVFGLPVSITHTVVGSILGFAIFASGGFAYVKPSGVVVVVVSWLAAPVAAFGVTALLFYFMRRDIFMMRECSFQLALSVLPHCLFASLLVDFFFIVLEQPPIMSQTLAQHVPLYAQYVILFALMFFFCLAAKVWVFPQVAVAAMSAQSFVWESEALRTELVDVADNSQLDELESLTFKSGSANAARSVSARRQRTHLHHHEAQQHTSAAGAAGITSAAVPPVPLASGSPAPEFVSSSFSPEHLNNHIADNNSANSSIYRCPTRSRPPTPAPLHPNASFVLSSITASDSSFVRKGGKVRLTPVHTRGHSPELQPRSLPHSTSMALHRNSASDTHHLPECSLVPCDLERHETHQLQPTGVSTYGGTESTKMVVATANGERASAETRYFSTSGHGEEEFGEEDWGMDHPMRPIHFGGIFIKPFNPRAEYLFTGLQVVAGSMSSFVHGAVAGANATSAFAILYDAFTDHALQEPGLSSRWSVLPAMLGIAIGMFGLGASLMKTVGMELVTVTPVRGWCIQMGGTLVTMVLTGLGIPVSLSQSQVGAAIGCGVLDAKLGGVSWDIVTKVVTGWAVTLIISALTTGVSMWVVSLLLCT